MEYIVDVINNRLVLWDFPIKGPEGGVEVYQHTT